MVKFDRLLGWSNPRKWKPIWQLWLQCKTPIPYTSMVCTLLYMEQTITPCMDLKSSLLRLLADYPNIDLHAMGFPQGWENEPLWR